MVDGWCVPGRRRLAQNRHEPNVFVTRWRRHLSHYKPAVPSLLGIDGVDMVTGDRRHLQLFGVKVKIDTTVSSVRRPNGAARRASGRTRTTANTARRCLLGGVHHLTGGSRRKSASPATRYDLSNCKP